MNRKLILAILIATVAAIAVYGAYAANETQSSDMATLTVYTDSPTTLGDLVQSIKIHPYYTGHDNDTLKWLESLESDYIVLSNNETYVVMSKSNADKLPIEYATDVSITSTFKCNIIENKSLGNDLKDIVYVDKVELISKQIKYFDV